MKYLFLIMSLIFSDFTLAKNKNLAESKEFAQSKESFSDTWYAIFSLGTFQAHIKTKEKGRQSWDNFFFADESKIPLYIASEMGRALSSQVNLGLKISAITLSHLEREKSSSEAHVAPLLSYIISQDFFKLFFNFGLGISQLEGQIEKERVGGYFSVAKTLLGAVAILGTGLETEVSQRFNLRLEYSYELSWLKGELVEEIESSEFHAFSLGLVWKFETFF